MHKLWLKVFALFLTTAVLFASGCLDKDSKTDTGADVATPEAPEDLNGAENIKDASGRFLSLPFNDSEVEIVQGYFYTWDKVDNPTHMGIDYIKVDKNNSWLHFEVLAAADGVAMQNEHEGIGLGKYIVIRHDETVNGMHYYSLYAHLDSVEDSDELSIPNRANWDANYDQWVRVSKGDSIGIAGDTGYPGYIHLHFEVFTGNTGSYQERTNNRVDPYDIKDYKNAYPQPPDVITGCGDKHLWIVGSSREAVLGVQSQKPFTFDEFGLESLGINKRITIREAKVILGEPLTIATVDIVTFKRAEMAYSDFKLCFDYDDHNASFDINKAIFSCYEIYSPDILGPRGIRVGDTIDQVLSSYLMTNDNPGVWDNPDAQYWGNINPSCVELYYLVDEEGLAKTGFIQSSYPDGLITSIHYMHYLPQSCGISSIAFIIREGVVSEIIRSGF